MLRHLCRLHCSAPLRSTAVATATAEGGLGEHNLLQEKTHRILAACILQRNPVVLRKQSEFEKAYDAYREALQYEYSRGVFDIMTTHKREMARVQDETSADLQEGALAADHTARQKDTPSRAKDSLALPALYPAYEEAEGQLSNIKRKLDRKIYLVVKDENGHWRFPSHHVVSTKTPLHKRLLHFMLGNNVEIYSVGCAPVAYHSEQLEERVAPPLGNKLFFFRSQLVGGHMSFTPSITAREYAWMTKQELEEHLSSRYYESVAPALSY